MSHIEKGQPANLATKAFEANNEVSLNSFLLSGTFHLKSLIQSEMQSTSCISTISPKMTLKLSAMAT